MGFRAAVLNPAGAPSFAETLEATRSGDSAAFGHLWRSLHPPLLRYLRVVAGDQAEDLASDTWLEVVRSIDRFVGDEHGFRGWLFTIARRRHLDWCRRQARRPKTVQQADLPEVPSPVDVAGIVADQMSTTEALDLIATLTPDQAEAITLRVIADLDVGTVAELMDRQPGAVRVLTHRGLRHLARSLDEAGAGEAGACPGGDRKRYSAQSETA